MNGHVTAATSIASLVARVADEFLEQLMRGEAPDVADYARRYPQVASVLPQVLPALRMIHEMAADVREPAIPPVVAGELGEFHLLREIGRGGMGIVYEAEQASLGRRVALKVLPAMAGMDAKQLARFQIETQVAAALHHPHIVPIFAVGCDRGIHYYAMQLVEGYSLAEMLRGPIPGDRGGSEAGVAPSGDSIAINRPTARDAARLIIQAAEALEHAHALGVLHRDIKPANLLVDDRGHLWVTDFGLARFQGGDDLTLSGDLPGTLRYMSPEQAAGGRVLDPRTDVYSLGATLYELLTARPALDGADRQDLLRKIALVEPTPPRKLDPTISRELETICLKAMAKEPDRRYQSARELAEDLACFLDDRPIRARRPGLVERTARWSRRHKRAVAIAAALLILADLAWSVGMARLWKEQQRTRSALHRAEKARLGEREALLFTFTASDLVAERALNRISMAATGRSDAEAHRDQEFCRKALPYYEEIAGRYRDDPEMQPIVAAAEHRVGFIRTILKDPRAEEAYRQSIALYQRLIAAEPRAKDLRTALALTYGDLAILFRSVGRPAEALDCFQSLLALRRGLAADFPGEKDNLVSLAYLQCDYIAELETSGKWGEAEGARRQLLEVYPPAVRCEPGEHRLRNNLAWLLASRSESSPTDVARAVALAEEAVALAPQTGNYRNTLGVARYRAGDWKAAAEDLEESMRLRSGGDAFDWLFLAMASNRLGNPEAARRWYDRSLSWIRANAPRNEELIRFRDEAARLLRPEGPPTVEAVRDAIPFK